MTEQQRIFLAVAACIGIMLVWPLFMGQKAPPTQPDAKNGQSSATATTLEKPTSADPAQVDPKAGALETDQAAAGSAQNGQVDPAQGGQVFAAQAESDGSIPEVPEERRKFETKHFWGEISNRGAALTALRLREYREDVVKDAEGKAGEREPVALVTAELEGNRQQAVVSLKLGKIKAPGLTWQESAEGFALAGTSPEGVKTQVNIKPRQDAYALDYTVEVHNGTLEALPVGLGARLALDPGPPQETSWFAPPANLTNGMCATAEGVERREGSALTEKGPWSATAPALWTGIDRQYFVVALVPQSAAKGTCSMSTQGRNVLVDYATMAEELAPGRPGRRVLWFF